MTWLYVAAALIAVAALVVLAAVVSQGWREGDEYEYRDPYT